MKKLLAFAIGILCIAGLATAEFGAQDYVPAASILLPYAVQDVDANDVPDVNGYATLWALTNVSSAPRIVHITVWNPISEAVVDWDILLTGYDVWTINLRDLLNGRFDIFDTDAGQVYDPVPAGYSYTPYAQGPSANDGSAGSLDEADYFYPAPANCRMPYGDLSSLGSIIRSKIRAGIKNVAYQYYNCRTDIVPNTVANDTWSKALGAPKPLFFYATADVARICTTAFQTTSTYWTQITNLPLVDQPNNLISDVAYLNSNTNFSEMLAAVHLEAGSTAGENFYEIDLYNTTVNNVTGNDDREPLGYDYGFRYYTVGVTTDVIVWKAYHDLLGSSLNWAYGCRAYYYYAWNEDELTKTSGGGPSGFGTAQPNAFPFETQMVPVNVTNFPALVTTPGNGAGWMRVIFDEGDGLNPPWQEAYVAVRYGFGSYSAAMEAALLSPRAI
jgi:hypothetical protein